MREIKFRVWDKKLKRMWHFDDPDYCDEYNMLGWYLNKKEQDSCESTYCALTEVGSTQEFELMQYTGLKDNTKWEQLSAEEQKKWLDSGKLKVEWSGKEIYEGDIVKYHCIFNYPENRIDNGIITWIEHRCGLFPQDIEENKRGGKYIHQWDDTEDLEVNGNIYENPELLK